MKLIALYHQPGENLGDLENFAQELARQRPNAKIDMEPLESQSGARLAELYGINTYPTILITADDGSLIRLWQGMPLPPVGEVSGSLA